jgi:hypothetical protein
LLELNWYVVQCVYRGKWKWDLQLNVGDCHGSLLRLTHWTLVLAEALTSTVWCMTPNDVLSTGLITCCFAQIYSVGLRHTVQPMQALSAYGFIQIHWRFSIYCL